MFTIEYKKTNKVYPQVTKEVYPAVAKMFNVSATKVERAIRHIVSKIQTKELKETDKTNGSIITYFALKELNLYLDTHPCCEQAICLFNDFNKKSQKLKNIYAEAYGPLTVDQTSGNTWDWIRNPWPWERMV